MTARTTPIQFRRRSLRIADAQQGLAVQPPPSEMLREAGYRQRTRLQGAHAHSTPRTASSSSTCGPRDIALYVGEGTLDVGITGRDLLLDSGAKAEEVLPLGLRRVAVPVRGPARRARLARRPGRQADRHVVRRGGARVISRSAASTPR